MLKPSPYIHLLRRFIYKLQTMYYSVKGMIFDERRRSAMRARHGWRKDSSWRRISISTVEILLFGWPGFSCRRIELNPEATMKEVADKGSDTPTTRLYRMMGLTPFTRSPRASLLTPITARGYRKWFGAWSLGQS